MKGVVQQPPVVFQTLLLRVTKYVLIPAALLSTNICTVHHFNTQSKKLIDFFGGKISEQFPDLALEKEKQKKDLMLF